MLLLLALYGLGWLVWMGLETRDWWHSHTWQVTRSLSVEATPDGHIRYGYTVEGWPYSGERSHFFYSLSYLDHRPKRWLDRNRGVTAVAVFYDPQHPNRSVLVRRLDSPWRLLPGVLLASLLPLALLLLWLKWPQVVGRRNPQ